MNRWAGVLTGAAVGVVSLVALATGCPDPEPDVEVRAAWSRPTVAARGASAGGERPTGPGVVYLTLVNRGNASDRLLGASSEVCDAVELHETRRDGDVMRMVPLEDGVEVPAGGRSLFEPGGRHLMLIGLRRHLREGERFEAVLRFERSGERAARVEVRSGPPD